MGDDVTSKDNRIITRVGVSYDDVGRFLYTVHSAAYLAGQQTELEDSVYSTTVGDKSRITEVMEIAERFSERVLREQLALIAEQDSVRDFYLAKKVK